jgi:hypothetical protein
VTSNVWANPHCYLKFDAKDENGQVQHWVAEASNPPDQTRQGWTKNSFKPDNPVYWELRLSPGADRKTPLNCSVLQRDESSLWRPRDGRSQLNLIDGVADKDCEIAWIDAPSM